MDSSARSVAGCALAMAMALVTISAASAQEVGQWVLGGREEQISEPPDNARPHCRWSGETRDQGARYSMSCTSPVSQQTVVTSGHVAWHFDARLDRLLPGQLLEGKGVVENTSTASIGPSASCTLTWNTAGFTRGEIVIAGKAGSCSGKLTVPRPGMRSDGSLITQNRLYQIMEFSNGAKVTRALVYDWRTTPVTPQGSAPTEPKPDTSSPGSDAVAPADFSGRWVVGTEDPALTEVTCVIHQDGNRVYVEGRMVYNRTEVLWEARGTIRGREMDTDLVYTKPYPAWGNAGDGKWVMTLSEDGQTLRGWYRNRLGQTGESHYVRSR